MLTWPWNGRGMVSFPSSSVYFTFSFWEHSCTPVQDSCTELTATGKREWGPALTECAVCAKRSFKCLWGSPRAVSRQAKKSMLFLVLSMGKLSLRGQVICSRLLEHTKFVGIVYLNFFFHTCVAARFELKHFGFRNCHLSHCTKPLSNLQSGDHLILLKNWVPKEFLFMWVVYTNIYHIF